MIVTMRTFLLGLALGLAALAAAATQTVTYFHNDLAGSPVVATNEQRQVVWRESYRPYGERRTNSPAASGNDIWFTNRRQDAETGLVYLGARYYDPVAGRFVSTDPAGFDEGNVHSFNRYAYANNNPYRYVDPDGRSPVLLLRLLGGGAIGGAAGAAADAVSQFAAFGSVDWGMAAQSNAAMEGAAAGALSFLPSGTPAGLSIKSVGQGAATGGAEATTVIGRVKDLQKLGPGERSLLDQLPDLGSPKANWQQNAGLLREEMRRGLPIRDASPGDTAGQFLNAERNLLQNRGWSLDPQSTFWMPPKP